MTDIAPVRQRVPQVQDFEDISLVDPKQTRFSQSSLNSVRRSPTSSLNSVVSDDIMGPSSTVSTPTLTSDTSSLRSSLSSISSPTLGKFAEAMDQRNSFSNSSGRISPPNRLLSASGTVKLTNPFGSSVGSLGSPPGSMGPPQPLSQSRRKSAPVLHANNPHMVGMGVDGTSLAPLTRLPSRRGSRSRKQREADVDADDGEDIWPGEGLMFNVPMSPALYRQQQKQLQNYGQTHTPSPLQHQQHPQTQSSSQTQPHTPPSSHRRRPQQTSRAPHPLSKNSLHANGPSVSPNSTSSPQYATPPSIDGPALRSASLPSIREVDSLNTRRLHAGLGPGPAPSGLSTPVGELPKFAGSEAHLNHPSLARTSIVSQSSSRRTSQVDGLDMDASEITLAFALEEELRVESGNPPPLKTPKSARSSSCSSDGSPVSRRTSLTRPENLPPKDPAEEEAHLRAYERMMTEAAALERKRKEQEEKLQAKRAEQCRADTQTWQTWTQSKTPSKVSRDLVWRGIPDSIRGKVWKMQIATKVRPIDPSEPLAGDDAQIRADTEQVWREVGIFGNGRPLHDPLVTIVRQYLGRYPEVKYDFGITQLAGLLLLNLDEQDAARALFALMGVDTLPYAVLSGNEQLATANAAPFAKLLKAKFPRLVQHCNEIDLTPMEMVNPMLKSCLSGVLGTPEAAARVIDVLAFESGAYLLRAALGIVSINEAWLYGTKDESLTHLSEPRVPASEDELMSAIRNVTQR